MVLDRELVKQFAAVMAPAPKPKSETKVFGTVSKVEDDVTYVVLDGSGIETPAATSVVCAVDDRVVVQIRDHKAYISDNFTASPDGRIGDKYYYFDKDRGLIIGHLDPETHRPEGKYVLITDTDYRIYNEYDEVLGVFGDNNIIIGPDYKKHIRITPENGLEIYDNEDLLAAFEDAQVLLGNNSSSAKVYFCDQNGNISYVNDTLVLEGSEATGLRSERTNGAVSQVAVAANDNQLAGALSILRSNGVVDGQVGVEYEAGVGTHVRLVGHDLTFNNNTVLVSNNLIAVGTANITGKIGVNKGRRFGATVTVPSGYSLAGIRQISTNHPTACVISGFGINPSDNEVFAYITNRSTSGNTYTVKTTIEWFAFRTNSSASGGTIDIDLGGGDGEEEQ